MKEFTIFAILVLSIAASVHGRYDGNTPSRLRSNVGEPRRALTKSATFSTSSPISRSFSQPIEPPKITSIPQSAPPARNLQQSPSARNMNYLQQNTSPTTQQNQPTSGFDYNPQTLNNGSPQSNMVPEMTSKDNQQNESADYSQQNTPNTSNVSDQGTPAGMMGETQNMSPGIMNNMQQKVQPNDTMNVPQQYPSDTVTNSVTNTPDQTISENESPRTTTDSTTNSGTLADNKQPTPEETVDPELVKLLNLTLTVEAHVRIFYSMPREERVRMFEIFTMMNVFAKDTPYEEAINVILKFIKITPRSLSNANANVNNNGLYPPPMLPLIPNYLETLASLNPFTNIKDKLIATGNDVTNYVNALSAVNPIQNFKEGLFSAGVNGVANAIDTADRFRKVGADAIFDKTQFAQTAAAPLTSKSVLGKRLASVVDTVQEGLNNLDERLTKDADTLQDRFKTYTAVQDLRNDAKRLKAIVTNQPYVANQPYA